MAAPGTGWRFWLGLIVLVVSFAAPIFIPLVAISGLPPAWKATLSGLLAFGIPEVGMLVAAGILGKEGFAHLKEWLLRILRRYGPPEVVGPARYRVGLVLFTLPLLYGLIGPYSEHLFHGFDVQRLGLYILGDAMMLVSLFVLGGEFWDKLRALFVHGARAVMPEPNGS